MISHFLFNLCVEHSSNGSAGYKGLEVPRQPLKEQDFQAILRALFVFKSGFALFNECGHAFFLIRRGENGLKQAALKPKAFA